MPAPPPHGYGYGNQGPSCFDKMKMGFTIGFCVGMASGAIFGGFSALRYDMLDYTFLCRDLGSLALSPKAWITRHFEKKKEKKRKKYLGLRPDFCVTFHNKKAARFKD